MFAESISAYVQELLTGKAVPRTPEQLFAYGWKLLEMGMASQAADKMQVVQGGNERSKNLLADAQACAEGAKQLLEKAKQLAK